MLTNFNSSQYKNSQGIIAEDNLPSPADKPSTEVVTQKSRTIKHTSNDNAFTQGLRSHVSFLMNKAKSFAFWLITKQTQNVFIENLGNGHTDRCKTFLDYGFNVKYMDENGFTFMQESIKKNGSMWIKILMENRDYMNIRWPSHDCEKHELYQEFCEDDLTMLQYALFHHPESLTRLEESPVPVIRTPDPIGDGKRLLWAIHRLTIPDNQNYWHDSLHPSREALLIKVFIKTGANLDQIKPGGHHPDLLELKYDTPLLMALKKIQCYCSKPEAVKVLADIVELLVNYGANVNIGNSEGETPLSIALDAIKRASFLSTPCDPESIKRISALVARLLNIGPAQMEARRRGCANKLTAIKRTYDKLNPPCIVKGLGNKTIILMKKKREAPFTRHINQ